MRVPTTPRTSIGSATAHDSMAHRDETALLSPTRGQLLHGRSQPFTPPETPAGRPGDAVVPFTPVDERMPPEAEEHRSAIEDPIFTSRTPRGSGGALPTIQPLFEGASPRAKANLNALVTRHMQGVHNTSRPAPTRAEYLLALSVVPIVSQRYAEAPRRWLQQERRFLDERFGGASRVGKRATLPAAINGRSSYPRIAPLPVSGGARLDEQRRGSTHRLPTPPPASVQPTGSRASRAPPPLPDSTTPTRTRRQRSRQRSQPRTPTRPQPQPQNTGSAQRSWPRRVVAPSREDVNFGSLPDFSPPLSTLPPNSANLLKAEWRGQALDLTNDPNRGLLHPAEIQLASTLRLSCATYLCTKRRIFQARIEAMRIGKEFRKTDSQQACKIDVNKASKLWTAYDRVGWLRQELFSHHLQR